MTRSLDDTIHFPPSTDPKSADTAEKLDKAVRKAEASPAGEQSEEYRHLVGHTPESAKADLDRAVRRSAAHPTPFGQARAERQKEFARNRKAPTDLESTIAAREPAYANYGDVRRAEFGRLGKFGGLVESRSDDTIVLSVAPNLSKEPVLVREAEYVKEVREVEHINLDEDGEQVGEVELREEEVDTDEVAVEALYAQPGDFIATRVDAMGDPEDGSEFVIPQSVLYDSYRPARRGPRGRIVP